MNYKTLKTGDIRKPGDEVRSTVPVVSLDYAGHKLDEQGLFRPVNLIGVAITESDLMHLEFRRIYA
jgi:hypothetical protein